MKEYDILIIGAGPAGLTAGIYAGRSKYTVGIIEEYLIGGQCVDITDIQNFPSHKSIDGMDLTQTMYEQCINFGVKFHIDEVVSVDNVSHIVSTKNDTFKYRKLILATGLTHVKPNIDNLDTYKGRGVSYCAVCDANLYKGKIVAVIGKSNTASKDVEYLSHYAEKVYFVCENKCNLKPIDNVQVFDECKLMSINGGLSVTNMSISDKNEQVKEYQINGLFLNLGKLPSSKYVSLDMALDDKGYIKTNEYMQTTVADVYAVGDIRNTVLRQIVTACSDGAIAATDAIKSLNKS